MTADRELLRTALLEAIALRVKLYRNGDYDGECDNMSDVYANKWSLLLRNSSSNHTSSAEVRS